MSCRYLITVSAWGGNKLLTRLKRSNRVRVIKRTVECHVIWLVHQENRLFGSPMTLIMLTWGEFIFAYVILANNSMMNLRHVWLICCCTYRNESYDTMPDVTLDILCRGRLKGLTQHSKSLLTNFKGSSIFAISLFVLVYKIAWLLSERCWYACSSQMRISPQLMKKVLPAPKTLEPLHILTLKRSLNTSLVMGFTSHICPSNVFISFAIG